MKEEDKEAPALSKAMTMLTDGSTIGLDGGLLLAEMIVAEMQRIRVPATSDAADKLVFFHEAIVDLIACLSFKHARITSPPVVLLI